MSLLKTAMDAVKVYLCANKQNSVNVQIQDEYYNVSIIYTGLDVSEDEYFIFLGEYGNESSDISIVKCKIAAMGIDNGAIIIELVDGKQFIITVDSECEIESDMYLFSTTECKAI